MNSLRLFIFLSEQWQCEHLGQILTDFKRKVIVLAWPPPPSVLLCLCIRHVSCFIFTSHCLTSFIILSFVFYWCLSSWRGTCRECLQPLLLSQFILLGLPQRVWPESILVSGCFRSARPALLKHCRSSCCSLAKSCTLLSLRNNPVCSVSAFCWCCFIFTRDRLFAKELTNQCTEKTCNMYIHNWFIYLFLDLNQFRINTTAKQLLKNTNMTITQPMLQI